MSPDEPAPAASGYWRPASTGSKYGWLACNLSKLAGQLVQDAQVDESVEFSGFYSSCPRCPRCFKGGAAAAAVLGYRFQVTGRVGARAIRYNEQSRYAISNCIATTASMLQHSAENLRGAGHVPARRDIILFFQRTLFSGSELFVDLL